MGMTGAGMADSIRSTMGFPTPVSSQLTGWGAGVVDHIQTSALVTNLTGTITGTAPPGGSLSNGAGSGGKIAGLSGSAMAALVVSNSGGSYPSASSDLSNFCAAIAAHIIASGVVAFASGSITGTCTNTVTSPGPLVAGAGTNGTISGLSGSALASLVQSMVGYPSVSAPLTSFCTALCNYIMANAKVSYASGDVTGTCPTGGGSLSNGAGAGGKVA